jgi:hypothetical protein
VTIPNDGASGVGSRKHSFFLGQDMMVRKHVEWQALLVNSEINDIQGFT